MAEIELRTLEQARADIAPLEREIGDLQKEIAASQAEVNRSI
jgi:hypothetical protein